MTNAPARLLAEFVGQAELREHLQVMLEAARRRLDLVVDGRTRPRGVREPGADFHALHGGDRDHRPREPAVELAVPAHVAAKPDHEPPCHHLDLAAQHPSQGVGIAFANPIALEAAGGGEAPGAVGGTAQKAGAEELADLDQVEAGGQQGRERAVGPGGRQGRDVGGIGA